MGLFLITEKLSTKSKKFSNDAKIEGIPLMSKKSGRKRKVKIFNGNG